VKAFAIDELGHPGSVREISPVEPGEGQVRVRVAAAGLNPYDNAVAQGYLQGMMDHRFPLVPGMDAAGTVESIGAGDVSWAAGDEVFGSVGKPYLGEGTLAELVTMSAATVARVPSSIDALAAAAVPVAGVTALTMIDSVSVSDGGVLVAIGATGGVGSYLVQLAASRGARVVAVCSAANAEYARSLGAVDTIDYAAGDVGEALRIRYPDGIDAIADMHGDKDQVAALAALLRPGGRVASAVGAADVDALRERGIGATNVMGIVKTAPLEMLAAMLERGELVTPELHSFPLSEAAQALASVGSSHARGKILVVPE
jgi:NADPH2:quinone reductase